MCFDLGLSIAIPTIIIPSLIGVNTNADETITSTSNEASWIGKFNINSSIVNVIQLQSGLRFSKHWIHHTAYRESCIRIHMRCVR